MMAEKRGITLWEIFKEKMSGEQEKPQEFKIYNPLKVRIGDFVLLDTVDELNGRNFTAVEIDVYHCLSEEGNFDIANYVLRESDFFVHLRIFPIANADPYSPKHCIPLALFPDCEIGYDEKLHKEVLPTGVLEVRGEKGELLATYSRRNSLKEPFEAKVTVIESSDSENPPKIEKWYFWDFSREIGDGFVEYYFVEMNAKNGSFQMFRGYEIYEQNITVLPLPAAEKS